MEIWHIHPLNDEKEHQLEGYDCPCDPDVQYIREHDRMLVTHNSFDGREGLEMANEILNGEND